ncbi:hypothetical protein BD410DRAFT_25756 [Rickenella mellea]|uniref:Uncharacterized protein n=1 Tax=Rickenella mellea TaxID=50990 RepID=A0A4R5XGJ1_9AGAM|nr:hypothetical protein BD410DRAFT_25756 [Rickenella mellea]
MDCFTDEIAYTKNTKWEQFDNSFSRPFHCLSMFHYSMHVSIVTEIHKNFDGEIFGDRFRPPRNRTDIGLNDEASADDEWVWNELCGEGGVVTGEAT